MLLKMFEEYLKLMLELPKIKGVPFLNCYRSVCLGYENRKTVIFGSYNPFIKPGMYSEFGKIHTFESMLPLKIE